MNTFSLFSKFILIFIFEYITFTSPVQCQASKSEQIITFYTGGNCTNETIINSYVHSSKTNTSQTLENVTHYTVNGLWRFRYCESFNISNCADTISTNVDCQKILSSDQGVSIKEIEGFGDAHQSAAEIVLYTDAFFKGNKYKLSPSSESNFLEVSPISVKSWYFTGNHAWSLFQSMNQTGNFTCVKPNAATMETGYGIRFEDDAKEALLVGSFRYGCVDPISPTLPPASNSSTDSPISEIPSSTTNSTVSLITTNGPNVTSPIVSTTQGPTGNTTRGPSKTTTSKPKGSSGTRTSWEFATISSLIMFHFAFLKLLCI